MIYTQEQGRRFLQKRKQLKTSTIVRHLKAIVRHSQDNDFTTLAQDEAIRQAIELLGGKVRRPEL